MGRIKITGGEDALLFLQKLVPKDLSKIAPGAMSGPTAFLNERAGFKDDVMLYNNGNEWYIVCNAINREKILDWLQNWKTKWGSSVGIEDITFDIVMFALQGPHSAELMKKLGLEKALELKMMQLYKDLESAHGKIFLVSRSGWTGEDGFEIWAKPEVGAKIFKALVENGATPAGLAARDTLRLEMGFVLYGHDIDENITPVEARYWVWTPGKTGYIGYEALKETLKHGVDRIRVGVKMKKKVKAIPREGDLITVEGEIVGKITSGNYSPTLKRGIGMGYVDAKHALIGLEIEANIRGRGYPGKLVDFPLVKK
jgi:aminomethyltransferase